MVSDEKLRNLKSTNGKAKVHNVIVVVVDVLPFPPFNSIDQSQTLLHEK